MSNIYYFPNKKIIVVIDGLSTKIHGNPKQRRRDMLQRAKARAKGYQVLEMSAQSLKDDIYLQGKLNELAIYLDIEELILD